MFVLTECGKTKAMAYINELKAKRKEILDAGKDTADETSIPNIGDIESDINFFDLDKDREYINAWGVTDNFNADTPLNLQLGTDIMIA